jgi:hypothetical protein
MNSIAFIRKKKVNSNYNFEENTTFKYEKWYRTNFTLSRMNLRKLPYNQVNFTIPKLPQMNKLSKLLEKNIKCDEKCLKEIANSYVLKEQPLLLNKSAKFEFWFKVK